jgi:hypothetical protein
VELVRVVDLVDLLDLVDLVRKMDRGAEEERRGVVTTSPTYNSVTAQSRP